MSILPLDLSPFQLGSRHTAGGKSSARRGSTQWQRHCSAHLALRLSSSPWAHGTPQVLWGGGHDCYRRVDELGPLPGARSPLRSNLGIAVLNPPRPSSTVSSSYTGPQWCCRDQSPSQKQSKSPWPAPRFNSHSRTPWPSSPRAIPASCPPRPPREMRSTG